VKDSFESGIVELRDRINDGGESWGGESAPNGGPLLSGS